MTTAGKASVHYRNCNLSEAMCGIEINVLPGERLDIRGDQNDPFTDAVVTFLDDVAPRG